MTITAVRPAPSVDAAAFRRFEAEAWATATELGADVAEVAAADLADLDARRPHLAAAVRGAARALADAGQVDELVRLVLLPPSPLPAGFRVTLACATGTRVVDLGQESVWDGRTPEVLAVSDVVWRTGVAAEHWTVTAVEPITAQP